MEEHQEEEEGKLKPQIIIENLEGRHNQNLSQSRDRLIRGNTYKDLSTICIVPTRGLIPAKVVQSWMGMLVPLNQRFMRLFATGMEVGEAYENALETTLGDPDLSMWKYILTLEDDNLPPPDGLMRLYEGMREYDVVGSLYWTKGEEGQPMIYGDPKLMRPSFIPQLPEVDTLQECQAVGMGFTLFKMSIFKDQRIPRPFFKTTQGEYDPEEGVKWMTQDIHFFTNIRNLGYKIACNTKVKVGHYDRQKDIIW
jgi:hypothetical protein